jgi:predicted permease
MDTLFQDLRYGVRMLLRMRSVSVVAILTLGLGIGATTTMFGVVYAALLRPLPFDRPDELAMLYVTRTTPREGLQRVRWSRTEIESLRTAASSFEALGSFTPISLNLTGREPEQIEGEAASPGYLTALRVSAARGRTFREEEDTTPGGHPVALISSRLWQRRFSSDPGIIGRTIGLNDVALTIVGIMPDGFLGLTGRADIWVPPTMAPSLAYSGYLTTPQHFISVIARLKGGVPLVKADAELAAIAPSVVRPESTPGVSVVWSATAWSLGRARIDAAVRNSVLVLLGAVACVLLIICVNVASLLLARARARRREIAIRLAIGSGRGRLVRQLLTESLVLALLGGSLGMMTANWGVDLIGSPTVIASGRNQFASLNGFATPAIDATVIMFALAITLGTIGIFGLVPALETSRPDLVTALKEDSRTSAGRHGRLLAGLVVSEVTLAVLLLTGAGLLIKSFVQMRDLRVGFVPEGVVTFWVTPPASRYAPADGPAIVERLLTRVQQVPGVVLATVNRCTPFDARCARNTIFFSDRPVDPASTPIVGRHYVSGDYFRTLGIPLRVGRVLTDQDRAGHPPVTVINETAARRYWPGQNPIGKRVWFGSSTGFTDPSRPVEIVGVVGDVKYGLIDDPMTPDFYTSYLQFTYPDTMMMVKTTQPQLVLGALREAVVSVDPGLPIYDVQLLDERIGRALSRPRLNASVLGAFALAALFLAAIGVYGVMAYSVSSRLHEIGVRLALGADGRGIVRLVLGQGARLAGLGAAIGLAAAFAATRLMRNLLFGVTPGDPIILAAVVLITMSVALLAALVPARRAAAVDPVVVLRNE